MLYVITLFSLCQQLFSFFWKFFISLPRSHGARIIISNVTTNVNSIFQLFSFFRGNHGKRVFRYCLRMREQQRDFADASHPKSAKSATRTVSYGIFSSENSYPYTATRFPLIASPLMPESSRAAPAPDTQPDPSPHPQTDIAYRALPNAPGLPRSGG